MKKLFTILAITLLSYSCMQAQKVQYGGLQQFGLNFGESGTSPCFTLVNGLRFGRFFTGIGADAVFRRSSYYNHPFNVSAIYADGRYYINEKRNFFAKLNGGVNLITQKLNSGYYQKTEGKPGYYAAVGLGFKARIGKEIFYTFDVSYCLRQTRYSNSYNYYPFRDAPWATEKFDIRQYTIMVNMGIEIF